MDRVIIGFAMAGGMSDSLHLSASMAGLAAGVFFCGYLLLQVPAGHIAEHGSAKRYIVGAILAWGSICIATSFVQNIWQLFVARFLLGVAEGGVYPALLTVIAHWFPRRELGRANALFLMSLPLSTLFTNPLAGWIVSAHGWRWLFLGEGLVSLVLIAIWLPMISDHPENAKWISREEKEYLVAALSAEKKSNSSRRNNDEGEPRNRYRQLFRDRNLWLLIGLLVCYTTGQYGYSIWLPTLVEHLTKQSLSAVGWLTTLPYLAAIVGLYLVGTGSDKTRNRRLWTSLSLVGFGFFLWSSTLFPRHIWISFGLLVVTGLFTKSMQAPFWAMTPLLVPAGSAGAARGIINALGNVGGLLGPAMVGWLTSSTGSMTFGIYGLALSLLLGASLTMLLPGATAGKTSG
ncbi:MAG: MFS transporter [Acidobacteria bacterium]|nr:MFS transporter [Acidobacteriota bacterium]